MTPLTEVELYFLKCISSDNDRRLAYQVGSTDFGGKTLRGLLSRVETIAAMQTKLDLLFGLPSGRSRRVRQAIKATSNED